MTNSLTLETILLTLSALSGLLILVGITVGLWSLIRKDMKEMKSHLDDQD